MLSTQKHGFFYFFVFFLTKTRFCRIIVYKKGVDIMRSNLGNKEVMSRNIKKQISQRGLNAKDFANDIGFKYTTVLDWLNAKTYPRIDKIEMMANYFNVEKSDLVEEESSHTSSVDTPQLRSIQRKAKSLSVADQERLLQLMDLTFKDVLSGGGDNEHDL